MIAADQTFSISAPVQKTNMQNLTFPATQPAEAIVITEAKASKPWPIADRVRETIEDIKNW